MRRKQRGARLAESLFTQEQVAALAQFAVHCLEAAFDDTIDGADVQDDALGLGLLRGDIATQGDCDHGFDGDVGDLIYREASWLRVFAQKGNL